MKYLLDSNIVSDLLNPTAALYMQYNVRLSKLQNEDIVYVSILTLYEFEYGYANAPNDKKDLVKRQINLTKEKFEILPLYEDATPIFGALKKSIKDSRQLSAKNLKQHNVDIILAATAILSDCILVSEDKLFDDLAHLDSRLHVEHW